MLNPRPVATTNPFFLMALLYLVLDAFAIAAVIASLAGATPSLPGLNWLRVHFLTVGAVTQVVLGALPSLAASHQNYRTPRTLLAAVWMLTNTGFVVLLVSYPSGAVWASASGAVLVLVAVLLAIFATIRAARPNGETALFYVAGPTLFLVGILLAISRLLGWPAPGGPSGTLEAHVHANVWGFLALVTAGVLVDRIPKLAGHPLPYPRLVRSTAWLLALGAGTSVAGPWFGLLPLTGVGALTYMAGTVLLLVNLVGTVIRAKRMTAVIGHLLASYLWMLAPVVAVPALMIVSGGAPSDAVASRFEATALSGLVTGWVLQVAIAGLIPQIAKRRGRQFDPNGHWVSVALINGGVALIWGSAIPSNQLASTLLLGLGYSCVLVGLLPPIAELIQLAAFADSRPEADRPAEAATGSPLS